MQITVLFVLLEVIASEFDLCTASSVSSLDYEELVPLSLLRQEIVDKSLQKRVIRSPDDVNHYDIRTGCAEGEHRPPNRVDTSERVASLRNKMKHHSLDALMIPSEDEHQNEYVAPADKRREFVTGFSGSAGMAILTQSEQALWTDLRYSLQANNEADCAWRIISFAFSTFTPTDWLEEQLPKGSVVGADVRLFAATDWESTEKKLNKSGIFLHDSATLVDEVWEEYGRPPHGKGDIFVHDIQYAGESWQEKVEEIRTQVREKEADLLVVSALDNVAWLLNLRGSDIPYTPVFKSYVILEAKKGGLVHLFIQKPYDIPEEIRTHFNLDSCSAPDSCVKIHPYSTIQSFLESLSQKEEIKKVLLSKGHPYFRGVSYLIYSAVPKEKREVVPSPVMLRKSKKEGVEGESMKEAQIKDSVALVEFFAFLEKEIQNGNHWDEISVLGPLEKFRSEQSNFRGGSFNSISAFGSNGAIVHYLPTNETKKLITDNSLYLLDSGGQYLDGTTDVTRTLHFGTPTPFQKEAYTRVLQGAIDLAKLVFPTGVKDIFIDIIARRPLYESGLNYGHGTGHGIGLYLNIHEGPTLLGMHENPSSVIEKGQFFSDEPGYYKPNDFGIRLESIVRVVDHPTLKNEKGEPMLKFEVVTFVPFEPKLIEYSLLSYKQCLFLNTYHKNVEEIIGRRLEDKGRMEALQWLRNKTKPITCLREIASGANIPKGNTILSLILVSVLYKIFEL